MPSPVRRRPRHSLSTSLPGADFQELGAPMARLWLLRLLVRARRKLFEHQSDHAALLRYLGVAPALSGVADTEAEDCDTPEPTITRIQDSKVRTKFKTKGEKTLKNIS